MTAEHQSAATVNLEPVAWLQPVLLPPAGFRAFAQRLDGALAALEARHGGPGSGGKNAGETTVGGADAC